VHAVSRPRARRFEGGVLNDVQRRARECGYTVIVAAERAGQQLFDSELCHPQHAGQSLRQRVLPTPRASRGARCDVRRTEMVAGGWRGAGDSCTYRWRLRSAGGTKSTRTVTCGCPFSRPLASLKSGRPRDSSPAQGRPRRADRAGPSVGWLVPVATQRSGSGTIRWPTG
jgi:hypothetical protein